MSPLRAKIPRTPPQRLRLQHGDVTVWTDPLWRIHRVSGAHPSAWNELRTFGPLSLSRWDPHPPPKQLHTAAGSPVMNRAPAVSYTASNPDTAFAEVFQDRKKIILSPDRVLSGWTPTTGLELLDLVNSDFAIRNKAAHMLAAAPRSTCRAWARTIWEQLGGSIGGLLAPSTMTGGSLVVLFSMSAGAFPSAPAFSRPLDHDDVAGLALRAGCRFHWPVA